jgi:hypothetical protein
MAPGAGERGRLEIDGCPDDGPSLAVDARGVERLAR